MANRRRRQHMLAVKVVAVQAADADQRLSRAYRRILACAFPPGDIAEADNPPNGNSEGGQGKEKAQRDDA